jgi:ABC-type sugar transport system permease subunit
MATVQAKPVIPPVTKTETNDSPSKQGKRRKLRNTLKAYLFIAPAFIILLVFHFLPIFYAFFLSLYRKISVVKGIVPPADKFAGFENYATVWNNPDFWNAFFNTLGYAAGVVIIGLLLALGLALLLDKVKEGRDFYRTAFFLPNVTSMVAVAAVWKVIFTSYSSTALAKANPNHPGGLLNWFFSGFGLPMQRWLLDERGIFNLIFNDGKRGANANHDINIGVMLPEILLAVIIFGLVVAVNRNIQPALLHRIIIGLAGVLALPVLALWLYLLIGQVVNFPDSPIGSAITIILLAAAAFWAYSQLPEIRKSPSTWASGYISIVGVMAVIAALINLAHAIDWIDGLSGPSMAMVCLITIAIWHSLGFNVVILLAGLTNISRELYEAARLDGAHGFAMFWRMTVPLLSPTLFFLLIISTIGAFQSFNLTYAIFVNGGNSTTISHTVNLLATFYYQAAFGGGSDSNYSGFGYASTIVIFMLVFILALTLVQQRVLGKRVNYD